MWATRYSILVHLFSHRQPPNRQGDFYGRRGGQSVKNPSDMARPGVFLSIELVSVIFTYDVMDTRAERESSRDWNYRG